MANPTTNFGWVMPTSASLVTNLPADFNTFGQAVDTSMAQLKGGTTGQILSKTSATDMAFTWITNDVGDITAVTASTGLSGGGTSGAVSLSIDSTVATLTGTQTLTNKTLTSPALTTPTISTLTTNGDTIYGTGSGAITRLGIGSTGNVLTVAGGVPTWAAPAGGGKVLQVVQATSTTSTTVASTTYTDSGLSASITPSSASSKILVLVTQLITLGNTTTGDVGGGVRIMRDSTVVLDTNNNATNAAGTGFNYMSYYGSRSYLDSPATTSATTYKTQGAVYATSNGRYIQFQNSSTVGTILLLEIGA